MENFANELMQNLDDWSAAKKTSVDFVEKFVRTLPARRSYRSQEAAALLKKNGCLVDFLCVNDYFWQEPGSPVWELLVGESGATSPNRLCLDPALKNYTVRIQDYRSAELFYIGLWARWSLMAWRRGNKSDEMLRSWVLFERVMRANNRDLTYNEKCWITHGRYATLLHQFCFKFTRRFGVVPLAPRSITRYHYMNVGSGEIASHIASNPMSEEALFDGNTSFTDTSTGNYLNSECQLVRYDRKTFHGQIFHRAQMNMLTAIQHCCGATPAGGEVEMWIALVYAVHAVTDYLAVISLATIGAIGTSDLQGRRYCDDRSEMFDLNKMDEFWPSSNLITTATTGFSPNVHSIFRFVISWCHLGVGRLRSIDSLNTCWAMCDRSVMPQTMFGLVGADIYEMTIGGAAWRYKTKSMLNDSFMRAYYTSMGPRSCREQPWNWMPNVDFDISNNGHARIYVFAPPSQVNRYSYSEINGRHLEYAMVLALGGNMRDGLDARGNELVRVLEGSMLDFSAIISLGGSFTTCITGNQSLYMDTIGAYRSTKFTYPQNVRIVPSTRDTLNISNIKTAIDINNAFYGSGFHHETATAKGALELNFAQLMNNSLALAMQANYISDPVVILGWSAHLIFYMKRKANRAFLNESPALTVNCFLLESNAANPHLANLQGWDWCANYMPDEMMQLVRLYLNRAIITPHNHMSVTEFFRSFNQEEAYLMFMQKPSSLTADRMAMLADEDMDFNLNVARPERPPIVSPIQILQNPRRYPTRSLRRRP